jgi:hypothetical protein
MSLDKLLEMRDIKEHYLYLNRYGKIPSSEFFEIEEEIEEISWQIDVVMMV